VTLWVNPKEDPVQFILDFFDRHPMAWLALGAALLAATHFRWGVDALAWFAWVPILRYLRLRGSIRSRFAVVAVVMVAMTVGVAKIVTGPIPLVMAAAFGVPIGFILAVPAVGFAVIRGMLTERVDTSWHGLTALLFPAFMVVGELCQHVFTPFGSWGAAAYTQLDDLALLQLASVTGLAGVSFVVYLVNAGLEHALHQGRQRGPWHRAVLATMGVALAVHIAGAVRLASFEVDTDTVRVAAVGSDATFGGLPLPGDAEVARIDAEIERRVRAAASQHAELIVWNEGSTLVMPDDREAFEQRWASIADELDVEIVAAWITPIAVAPLTYENVSVTFRPDGSRTTPYLKQNPVPGEPAVKGTGPLPVIETSAGTVGTAICYDADFPRLGLGHAANDLSILALPSSDWRGIDPVHTEMATLRAIEGGYGILRSTRLGLSAGIDATGRMRGRQSWFDSADKVLLVDLPRAGTPTVYAALGDWFAALCAIFGALAIGLALALRLGGARVEGAAWQRRFRLWGFARS
jgi:apolipoprotein N-acyltransferase